MNQLRDIRIAHGMTKAELANLLDVHVSNVARWESGKRRICAKHRKKLCQVLGCTEDDLADIKSA